MADARAGGRRKLPVGVRRRGRGFQARFELADGTEVAQGGFRTAREAATWRTREMAKVYEGKSPVRRSRMTVTAFMEGEPARGRGESRDRVGGRERLGWLHEIPADTPATTSAAYWSMWCAQLKPHFGETRLQDITPEAVRRWMLMATRVDGKPLSDSRRRQVYYFLAQVLDDAVAMKFLAENPVIRGKKSTTKLPDPPPKREMEPATVGQIERLARTLGAQHDSFGLLIYTLAYTGLRWSEAAGLTRRRVNLLRGRLVVQEVKNEVHGRMSDKAMPKNSRRREEVLPPFLKRMFEEHLATLPTTATALVFTMPRGGPLRSSNFRRLWSPALVAVGLADDFQVHDLRRTCASILADGLINVVLDSVREHLGHSEVQTTRRYLYAMPELQPKIADVLEALYLDGKKMAEEEAVAHASNHNSLTG